MSSELVRRVVQARAGGATERCHGIRHLGSYSNAAHSWGVAMLALQLYPERFPRIAVVCLTHDVPEFIFGDVPAPTLRYVPGVREGLAEYEGRVNSDLGLPPEHSLDQDDAWAFKSCDRLELYLWCREQELLGNQFARECLRELERYFAGGALESRAHAFYETLKESNLLPSQAGEAERIVNGGHL